MKIIKNIDKKKLAIAVAVIVVLLGLIFLIIGNYNNKHDKMNGLTITYKEGKNIKYRSFKKGFTKKRTITIKNTSKENKTYSLEWKDVTNSLEKQNKFTYEITCTGDRRATLGKSQVPVAGFQVFPQALIEAGKTQTYTIELKYNGSEKGKKFKGQLVVHSEKEKVEKHKEKEDKIIKDNAKKDLKNTTKNKTKKAS